MAMFCNEHVPKRQACCNKLVLQRACADIKYACCNELVLQKVGQKGTDRAVTMNYELLSLSSNELSLMTNASTSTMCEPLGQ
jgi:hypothetical protein